MKWLLLFLFILPIGSFAQTDNTPKVDPSDTVKVKRLKNNKPEESNDYKMGTAYDIWENTSQTPRLSTLAKSIKESGMIATFRSNGPITLFAPNNEAFKKLPKGKLATLMKRAHVLDMSNLLSCQALPGKFDYGDLDDIANDPVKGRVRSLGGNIILVKKNGEDIFLIDEMGNKVNIVASDLLQRNGYIHVINKVLLPKPRIE